MFIESYSDLLLRESHTFVETSENLNFGLRRIETFSYLIMVTFKVDRSSQKRSLSATPFIKQECIQYVIQRPMQSFTFYYLQPKDIDP